MDERLKNFLLIGIIGSFYVKLIEWYAWLGEGNITWSQIFGVIGAYQIISLIILSGLISLLFYHISRENIISMYIPSVWLLTKDLLSISVNNLHNYTDFIMHTIPESILIALPIGLSLYFVIFVKKWHETRTWGW